MKHALQRRARKAFTLVEVMITMAIFVVVMAMVMPFLVTSMKEMFIAEQKNLINTDIRDLTNEMMDNARMCTTFIVYPDYESTDAFTDRVQDGGTGDMLVLVEYDDTVSPLEMPKVKRVVAYYRAPDNPGDPSSLAPVRKYEKTYDPTVEVTISTETYSYTDVAEDESGNVVTTTEDRELQAYNIEDFLPPLAEMNSHPEVVELSRGLSNGKLFTVFWNRSIVVNGRIYHGNEAKRVTDTYNFTISPRG